MNNTKYAEVSALCKTQDKAKLYIGSSLMGMSRVIIGFPIEHPIDAIKV